MKSVRLDPELEAELARAARTAGVSESNFIREAVRRRCDEVLRETLAEELMRAGVVGSLSLGGGVARKSGRRFAELLAFRREERR